jgi:DNA repair photolyase
VVVEPVKRRRYTEEFKADAAPLLLDGHCAASVCERLGLSGPNLLYAWKRRLIERDVDLLAALAEQNLVHAALSITTLDAELARSLEPRTSRPEARLRAIRELSAAGVPMAVMVAPTIPGLNDSEIPAILEVACDAGRPHPATGQLRLF